MLVSIIVSVYNCEKFIEEMLNSILEQTYTDWELILIDDNSTDSTWSLISKYTDKRIITRRNTENFGLTKNLNIALSHAKGKYVVRIDGDDIAYPNRLEKQVEYMEKNPDIVLSGSWMRVFGKREGIWKNVIGEDILKINLIFNAIIFHPTFIIRKNILDKYKILYNESLAFAQDYDLEYQISKYGKVANIPDLLVKYRIHDKQVSISNYEKQLECANITRKNILKELDISIDEDVFYFWQRFCLLDYHYLTQQETFYINDLCKKIIENNTKKEMFRPDLLNKVLNERMRHYIERCSEVPVNINKNDKFEHKYYSLFMLMCNWMEKKQNQKKICMFLNKRNIKSIAIYGMGNIGILLLRELELCGINVKYGIDEDLNTSYMSYDIKIYRPSDFLEKVEAIIVTPITYFEEIKEKLSSKVECPIFSLQDILDQL